jgi:ABC-2 type transport system permease protein
LLIPALGLAVMPLSLLAGGSFDAGQFACAFAGVLLVAAFAAAAGLYVSAATAHPAVAVIGTMMLLLLLWFSGGLAGAESGDSLRALSIAVHLQNLMNGIIDTADVAYFAIGTAGFLALAIARLANERAPV